MLGVHWSRVVTPRLYKVIPLFRALRRSWTQDPEKILLKSLARASSFKGVDGRSETSGERGKVWLMQVSMILFMRSKLEYWSDCPLRRQPTATRSNKQRAIVSPVANNLCIVVWKKTKNGKLERVVNYNQLQVYDVILLHLLRFWPKLKKSFIYFSFQNSINVSNNNQLWVCETILLQFSNSSTKIQFKKPLSISIALI